MSEARMVTVAVLAEFTDYQGMLDGLRARADGIHIARGSEATARLSGLPDKYLAKLLGPRPVRRIGMKTLGPTAGLLQIKFLMVVDEDAVKRFGSRVEKRNETVVRGGTVHCEFSHRHMSKIRKKGGHNSRKYMSPKRARQLARNAAHVRWDRVKAAVQSAGKPCAK